jgi:hypothetical protein
MAEFAYSLGMQVDRLLVRFQRLRVHLYLYS